MRVYRDLNAAGAATITAVALATPGPNVILAGVAAWNAVQVGASEVARRKAKSKTRRTRN